jgi:hypothetical protein
MLVLRAALALELARSDEPIGVGESFHGMTPELAPDSRILAPFYFI